MGKQGPCYHCGVTSTPLWRNGPPEKPVLCNACGSRWRTKGSLANYTPLHARVEFDDFEGYKVPKVRTILIKTKEAKLHKGKQTSDNVGVEQEALDYDQYFKRGLEEDISNRSSSGSAISYSESCAQFGGTDASSAQSVAWDTQVPSKKRTCFSRPKPSPIEKLTEDLCSILHEQQSSYFSGSSEEDLIFENSTTMVSGEIGHGSFLIKHPNSAAREEESEASSLSIDKKTIVVNEVHSGSTSLHVHIESKGTGFPNVRIDKIKKPLVQVTQGHMKRDKSQHEKLKILRNPNSPLRSINLKDVVNFEEFQRHLTHEEQELLMTYLPLVDTAGLQDSLKNMFNSPQFMENLSSFQKLLGEGVFDLSFSGENTEECKTLKRLVIVNLKKSNWVEHYNLLKDVKCKQIIGGKGVATGLELGSVVLGKRHRDGQNQKFSGPKATMKIPKRVIMKASYETKDVIDNDGSCFSPISLFATPPDRSSLMLDCFQQFDEDSSNQDLLLDVPSNGYFPQAELLHPLSSFGSRQILRRDYDFHMFCVLDTR